MSKEAAPESPTEEVTRLRSCLNDLVGMTALPAVSTDGEPTQVLSTLFDALLKTLRLAFVFVRLNDPDAGSSIEITRVAESFGGASPAELSLASARVGLSGPIGLIVAGSERRDFPTLSDRVVLDIAANHAAMRLQQAQLLSERKRFAANLHERVAQRTSELLVANERLREELSHHQRAAEALRQREQEARLIVETIPGLVAMLTPAGEVDVVNQQLVEYCGQPLEAMKQWGTNGTVHSDDLPQVAQVFTKAITSGEPYDFEARIRRFDGIYRWLQVRGLPLRDRGQHIARWYVLLTDIDDRKRAESELRKAYDSFADAQRLSKTGSFITDLGGDDHNWSEEALRIFEFDPATKITLQTIRDVVHPEDMPVFEAAFKRAIEGLDVSLAYRIITSGGNVKHVRAIAHVTKNMNGQPVFVGALQDVTEAKAAEEALNRAGTELAHVSRVTTVSALTASIAHEVNQPLSGIITNAGTCLRMLAADPPDVDGARETARRTLRDGNRASDVITRLRALFSKREFTLEPLDMNDVTREVVALSMSDLQRNRIVLQSEFADDLPLITGDRIQLQQVVLNLIRNAADAMVAVDDRPRQLLIRTARDADDRVRVSVRDAGVGLDAQRMTKLFDAFYTTKVEGMGIGLSVSRSIIEKHHGRLWAEPNDGPGATFSFSIPFPEVLAGGPQAPAS